MDTVATLPPAAAVFIRPCAGEMVSGDIGFIQEGLDSIFLALIDVSGHGSKAHQTALMIQKILEATIQYSELIQLMESLHRRLSGGLGAAVSMAFIDKASGDLQFLGVGNVTARILGSARRHHFVSKDGTLGQKLPNPLLQQEKLTSGEVILMTTDGVSSRVDWDNIVGWQSDSPERGARRIVSAFGKDHDDAGCIFCRYTK